MARRKRGKNGQVSFDKKGNSYEARITVKVNGKSVRKSFSNKDKREAERRALNFKMEAARNQVIDTSNAKVSDWVKKYIIECKKPRVKPNTLTNYVGLYERNILNSSIADIKLDNLKRQEVQQYVNELQKRGLSAKTIKDTYLILNASLDEAVLRKMLYENVANKILLPKIQKKPKRVLSQDEETLWLKLMETDSKYLCLEVLLLTGMRVGELCGLKWCDIDFDNDKIYINSLYQKEDVFDDNLNKVGTQRVEGTLKTDNSERKIILNKRLKQRLLEYKTPNSNPDDFVFVSKKGTTFIKDTVRARLNRFIEKFNLRYISLHDFRHTYATRCMELGINPKMIQTYLGHSDFAITGNIYIHNTEQQDKDSLEIINKMEDERK